MSYLKLLLQLVGIYIFVNILFLLLSDSSLFVQPHYSYHDTSEIIKISTNQGTISARFLKNTKAKYTILYSHGNGETIDMLTPVLQNIYDMGFSVISYDYSGYGTSSGSPSEQATYADILAVYNYLLKQNIKPEHIILFGRSLGSGPSIELAANKTIGGLVLEGAFMSAYRVVTYFPIFLFDKYKNIEKINKINVPILFIHGQQDAVIPSVHGKKLYAEYSGPKYNLWLKDKGHNDITTHDYQDALLSYINSLSK